MTPSKGSVVEFEIDGVTPSLNKTLRMHWRVRQRQQANWYNLIAEARGRAKYWDRPSYESARISIIRQCMRPIADIDNLIGGGKGLIDSLVQHQIVADDSAHCIGAPSWTQSKGPARMFVRIEPMP